MEARPRRLTDAYSVGIELREQLRAGTALTQAFNSLDGPFDTLEDGYPKWHPAPYSFHGMLRLFLYRELTGQSYRELAQYPELASVFGLKRIPDESVLSRTWRNRFDDAVREFITTAAHYVVREIHDNGPTVPEIRPKEGIITPRKDPREFREDVNEAESGKEFTDKQIAQRDWLGITASWI